MVWPERGRNVSYESCILLKATSRTNRTEKRIFNFAEQFLQAQLTD